MFRRLLVLSRTCKLLSSRVRSRIPRRNYLSAGSLPPKMSFLERTKQFCLQTILKIRPTVEKVIKDETTGKIREKYFISLSHGGGEVRNGPYVAYTPKGTPYVECSYFNGQLHGKYTEYEEYEKAIHIDGRGGFMDILSSRAEGSARGCDTIITALDRLPILACNYFHGQLHGRYEENQTYEKPFNVYGGPYRGWYIKYNLNIRRKEVANFLYGRFHGLREKYNERGIITQQLTYEDDRLHGMTIIYEPYGDGWKARKKRVLEYKNGRQDGEETEYTYKDSNTDTVWYTNTYEYKNGEQQKKET